MEAVERRSLPADRKIPELDCTTDIWVNPADHSKGLLIHTNFINSIVGNSTTDDNCNGDPADLIISTGHNIETTANTCGFNASGDIPNVSPAVLFRRRHPEI